MKVYEGEWLNNEPRCGVFRPPTGDEENKFRDATIVRQNFNLPELGLKNPQLTIELAKAETRIINTALKITQDMNDSTRQEEDRPFTPTLSNVISADLMYESRVVFNTIDQEFKNNGLLPFEMLNPVFNKLLGVDLSDDNMEEIRSQLEIGYNATLEFSEAVDIATLIAMNNEYDQQNPF